MEMEKKNAARPRGTDSGEKIPFHKRHPDLPMWISLTALIASIAMPIIRQVLGQTP